MIKILQTNSLNVETLKYTIQETLSQCREIVLDLSNNTIKIVPQT